MWMCTARYRTSLVEIGTLSMLDTFNPSASAFAEPLEHISMAYGWRLKIFSYLTWFGPESNCILAALTKVVQNATEPF